jgi:hypothetical protein
MQTKQETPNRIISLAPSRPNAAVSALASGGSSDVETFHSRADALPRAGAALVYGSKIMFLATPETMPSSISADSRIQIDDLTTGAYDDADDFSDIACPDCGTLDPFAELDEPCRCQSAVIEPFSSSAAHPLLQAEDNAIIAERDSGFDEFDPIGNPDTYDLEEAAEFDAEAEA